MVSKCKSMINLVIYNMPKMLWHEPNGKRTGSQTGVFCDEDVAPPGKNRHLTFLVIYVEHGKPVSLPFGQADRKESC